MRKTGLEVQQAILRAVAEKTRSLRELETAVNTNYRTIRAHCNVLEFYGMVELTTHKRSDANGRPYTTVAITEEGRKLVRRLERELRR